MGDESKTEGVLKAVEGIAKAVPIYPDLVQPAAKEMGGNLATVARCVTMVLSPLKLMVWGYDQVESFLNGPVADKLAGVPPEKIITPKPEVAVPAIEALRYTGHAPDLREMFAKLLATSMNTDKAPFAHPGFIDIIKSLSPDEARIMKVMGNCTYFPMVDVHRLVINSRARHSLTPVKENFSLLGWKAGCEYKELQEMYLSNLLRLGLVERKDVSSEGPNSEDEFNALQNHPELDGIKLLVKDVKSELHFKRKWLVKTAWGDRFCIACVYDFPGSYPWSVTRL